MKRSLRSAILAAAVLVAAPALAHPPGEDDDGKADAATAPAAAGDAATSPAGDPDGAGMTARGAPATVDARAGAGGMEPTDSHGTAQKESREDRDEREFVTAIWNSP
jgi:hypothetical protein